MAEVTTRKRRITLHLYDTELSMNIPAADEEFYRNGERLITRVIDRYAMSFRGVKTEKEILYMAMIDIALRYEKEAARKDVKPYENILSKLTSEIEDALR